MSLIEKFYTLKKDFDEIRFVEFLHPTFYVGLLMSCMESRDKILLLKLEIHSLNFKYLKILEDSSLTLDQRLHKNVLLVGELAFFAKSKLNIHSLDILYVENFLLGEKDAYVIDQNFSLKTMDPLYVKSLNLYIYENRKTFPDVKKALENSIFFKQLPLYYRKLITYSISDDNSISFLKQLEYFNKLTEDLKNIKDKEAMFEEKGAHLAMFADYCERTLRVSVRSYALIFFYVDCNLLSD